MKFPISVISLEFFSAVFRCEININEFYYDKACHLSAFLIFICYCDLNSLFEVIYQFIIAWRMPGSNQIYKNIYVVVYDLWSPPSYMLNIILAQCSSNIWYQSSSGDSILLFILILVQLVCCYEGILYNHIVTWPVTP